MSYTSVSSRLVGSCNTHKHKEGVDVVRVTRNHVLVMTVHLLLNEVPPCGRSLPRILSQTRYVNKFCAQNVRCAPQAAQHLPRCASRVSPKLAYLDTIALNLHNKFHQILEQREEPCRERIARMRTVKGKDGRGRDRDRERHDHVPFSQAPPHSASATVARVAPPRDLCSSPFLSSETPSNRPLTSVPTRLNSTYGTPLSC